jgi:hypothetical protein
VKKRKGKKKEQAVQLDVGDIERQIKQLEALKKQLLKQEQRNASQKQLEIVKKKTTSPVLKLMILITDIEVEYTPTVLSSRAVIIVKSLRVRMRE